MTNTRIQDLPHAERLAKLAEITPVVEVMMERDLPPGGRLYYGLPLYQSFGMTKLAALQDAKSDWLMLLGCDLKV